MRPQNTSELKDAIKQVVKEVLPDILRQSSIAIMFGRVTRVDVKSSLVDVQTVQGNVTFKSIRYIANNGANIATEGDLCNIVTMDNKSPGVTFAIVFTNNNIGSVTDFGVWKNYDPTVETTGTAPSLGNGTLTGQYTEVGDLVIAHVHMIWGSTSTAGTGSFLFDLPFPTVNNIDRRNLGSASMLDSGTQNYSGTVTGANGTNDQVYISLGGTGGSLSGTTPFTIAVNDVVSLTIVYNKSL